MKIRIQPQPQPPSNGDFIALLFQAISQNPTAAAVAGGIIISVWVIGRLERNKKQPEEIYTEEELSQAIARVQAKKMSSSSEMSTVVASLKEVIDRIEKLENISVPVSKTEIKLAEKEVA